MNHRTIDRREFVKTAGSAIAGASFISTNRLPTRASTSRRRYSIVGTGDRASSTWGRDLVERYPDVLEFVGLCDSNSKRAAAAKALIGVDCPTFTVFDEMIQSARPDLRLAG